MFPDRYFPPRYYPNRYFGGTGAAFVPSWLLNGWWLLMTPNYYNKAIAIVPSNTDDIPTGPTAAIYCGGAGVVRAVFEDDDSADFTVVAGETLPVRAKRVNSTGTTATLLVAMYQI